MDTTPQNDDTLERRRQEADILGVVSPRPTMLSWGERLLPYLFAAMETCWVDAIIIGIAGTSSAPAHEFFLPLWVPFVLIAGTCWLSNYLAREYVTDNSTQREVSSPRTLLIVWLILGTTLFSIWSGLYASSVAFFNPTWLGSLVADVFLLGPEAFHIAGIIALVLYFYWRGLRLARSTLESGNVFHVIRLGLGILFAVIVFRAATNAASFDEVLLLLLIPLFLMCALLAHAFAQAAFVRTTHRVGLQGSILAQERALLAIIVAFGSVLLVLSLLVGAVASPAFLTDAHRIFIPIVILYDWFAHIIAFVLSLIVDPFIWLLQLFHFRLYQIPTHQVQSAQAFCKKYPHAVRCLKNPQPTQDTLGAFLLLTGKILLPLLIVLLIVLIIRLVMRRRNSRLTQRVEVHESLWSWELFLTQLKALFHALWLRLFPQSASATQIQGAEDEMTSEPTARSIREIYRAMLRWAAQHGYPRKKNETPYEFRSRLHTRLPLTEPELSTVTEAYTAIRYGRVVPSEAEVAHVQQTWTQLRQKVLDKQGETY
ncbi:MAG: hypothetical protein NVS4B11_35010 [Ktedonobacteraceae bacterium]